VLNKNFLQKKMTLSCLMLGLFMLLLSDRSGYSLGSDVESMNWDIALMLSPVGLIRAYVVQPDFYLRPYYLEVSARGELFRDPVLVALIFAVGVCALSGLLIFRRDRNGGI
jgi:hypothetical protein